MNSRLFALDSRQFALHNKAFTLVEILIALAILAMIVASTFTIFRSSAKSWQKGEIRSERYHNARVAIGRMSMEISQAVIIENSDARFIGQPDEVSFVSFVSSTEGVFEQAEIEYWFDSAQKVLMRNEDAEPDYDFSTQDYSDILADGISELEFSYYDGSTWVDSWDSRFIDEETGDEVDSLPKAVKIKIQVQDKKAKESENFEVITHLKIS
ncbi:MAG: prepilin-type N-terminal cleavage/methylation domain-containing protein [Candidatus Omnitrophica bacterium]|nr:prepilin-type N-terminal cleavage/methylation domain-containing protein [Candidatus Omnitrophota bacterium]